jgi:DNA adenine methylase
LSKRELVEDNLPIKPFIKWAGGKTQLLEQIKKYCPSELLKGKIKSYYEPFLGGGAFFLNLCSMQKFDNVILSDVNKELVLTYLVVKNNTQELLQFLHQFKETYLRLPDKQKEIYYYEMRDAFNIQRFSINYIVYNYNWISRAAQFIFLNKTCFNGLFRINQKGDFNVPFGKRYNPEIFIPNNLITISKLISNAEISSKDFSCVTSEYLKDSFFFLDPPYRPLIKCSNFTSYNQIDFKESDQLRLVTFFKNIDRRGAKIMMTNSNPENGKKQDNFFYENYSSYNIHKIKSARMINNISGKRYILTDLLITNY